MGISSNVDINANEMEGSIDKSHQSTEITEQMDDQMEDLEDISLSAKSDLIDIEMDDLSNSAFDGNFDDLFVDDYPLFEVDSGFENFSNSTLLKEQALGFGGFAGLEDVLSSDKNFKTHTGHKAAFVSSGFDGFSALP